jgi:peroxiredoxin
MKKICLVIFVLFSVIGDAAFAQEGYNIKFKITGLKDTTCIVANYYGNGTYVKDTLKVDGAGRCTFRAPDSLPRGVYILVITDKNYFEFIVNNDKKFSIETEASDPEGHLKVTGSPENTLFYDYLKYNREQYAVMQSLQSRYQKNGGNSDSLNYLKKQIIALNDSTINYKLEVVKNHPQSFLAFMINAMKEPAVPEPPTLPNGRIDSTFGYRYFKAHFWDDTDFTDDRLLRTPVFHNKLKRYFDQVVMQLPDSIIPEIDRMAEKARPNREVFKYIVWFSTWHYENSEVMGFDEIFVHVVDTYYATGQAYWTTGTTLENLVNKAKKLKPILIGNVAPNMVMMDTSGQLVSMQSIQANILILLFWDPDCGHCVEEIPRIREFYDQYKKEYGVEVFAVCSDTSMVKMKREIRKRDMHWINVDGPRSLTGNYHDQYDIKTTPVLFILNRNKVIIAKQLKTDQIATFVKNYLATAHP